VRYTPAVVGQVAIVTVVAVALAIPLVRAPSDWASLITGAAGMFLLALFSVQATLPVQFSWSASIFVHIGMALVLGPVGAAVGAVSEALGVAIRTRSGWFRTVFNVSNEFLSGLAAYETFTHMAPVLGSSKVAAPVAGLAAGVAHFAVNHLLIAAIVHATEPVMSVLDVLRDRLSVAPFSVGYGWSAFAFVVLHEHVGFIGFVTLLVPVAMLQGAFVVFASKVRVYEEQRAAHQRERENLLQKAVEASETERRRIARDLHDGVVQNLSGMAFAMTAAASRVRSNPQTPEERADLLELLEHSANETRQAMKDLRTLIIEIAPPTLRREGLHAALLEVMRTLEDAGTRTRLELPSNMRLRQDRASLVFRVAQEVLRNVAAHADARNVSVVLQEVDGLAVLRIKDDGKGFTADDVARRRAQGHVGTNAIVELAEEAGGSLHIESEPGSGTRVTLELPVES
jgi:signal transduction histidine kinase